MYLLLVISEDELLLIAIMVRSHNSTQPKANKIRKSKVSYIYPAINIRNDKND